MPKNIFVSNSGSHQEILVSVDDNNALSSSISLTINTASYIGQNSIMQIFNGRLIPVATASISDPQGNYSGSVLSYNPDEGFGPYRTDLAQFAGDITGSLITALRVREISHVESGTLSSLYGGTSNTSYTFNSLVETNGSGPTPGQNNQIIAAGINGEWGYADPSILNFTPMTGALIYLYTGSLGVNNTFTWIKPQGCRFIRVICQGGGGGGGTSHPSIGTDYAGGGGGGGGGYSDITYNALNIENNINIIAGAGGVGATGINSRGGNGGSSSFGNYIISYGGQGGAEGYLTRYVATGSAGYNYTGGDGGTFATSINAISEGKSVVLGGAGGGYGGYNGTRGHIGGAITALNILPGDPGVGNIYSGSIINGQTPNSGSMFAFNSYYLNSTSILSSIPFPNLIWAGGSGGGASDATKDYSGDGSSPEFGSGGGGAGEFGEISRGIGGNGGKGYVLIICT